MSVRSESPGSTDAQRDEPAERLDLGSDPLALARSAFPPRGTRALKLALHRPRAVWSVFRAKLSGRRLRAAQSWAALAGIDHRLTLPQAFLGHVALAPIHTGPIEAGAATILAAPGHRLTTDAVHLVASAFAADPLLQALYGDSLVEFDGRPGLLPVLRPAFDPEFLTAVDYVGPVAAVRSGALTIPPANATDAVFRIFERHGRRAVGHLPRILSVGRTDPLAQPAMAGSHACTLRDHLDRTGQTGARIAARAGGGLTLLHPLPDPLPVVSLIVPTRDRLDLLRPCIESLSRATEWPEDRLELLICDNDSADPDTHAYFRDLEARGAARIVPCPGTFNFAAMNNRAAAGARGTLLVFVNNDVEAFEPGWLTTLARQALRPDIGAVGAKLLDGAGRIQHGGIVLGTGGLVTHGHRHFPGDAPGYLAMLEAPHEVSAVTAACLAVEARKFASVGGFDAGAFPVDFNDVDLCLRLNAAGFRTLLAPGAVLHHREAASRRWTPEARARHAGEVEALKRRWGPLLAQDPHYHPGFDPNLSTHARLRPGHPVTDGPVTVRVSPY